ncbi:protein FAM117A isoform X4 [Strix uralensis]|uniref:protein FAM117A isoform X4 n=1 Tax=Strix uralensis TaxID=36305 RepID=UPI003DA7A21D
MQGLMLLLPSHMAFCSYTFSHLELEFHCSNGILADKKMYLTGHVPGTVSAVGAAAPLYTEVFGKHTIALNSFNAGFSVVNSLPACHALILGRKENICTQSTWSIVLCVALIPCQEATGPVLMCVVICMSNQNEMQTNLPAGLNLPLSCYLFGFGDNTFFFPAARVTTGLQKRAGALPARGPRVNHSFGAGRGAMEGKAQQNACSSVPCAAAVEKICRPRQPRVRRTSSLDTIVGSYLLGQWPREAEGASTSCMNDKATQDSPSGFLSPSPILRLSPCLHRSLEGLNQELEEAFVKEQGDEELWRILDVPDGHRAPAPAQRGSGDTSITLEPSSGSCSSLSLSPSPSVPLHLSPHTPGRLAAEEPSSAADEGQPDPKEKEEGSPSPVLAFASSPRPNHSYMFKREPPEGCEKVRAFEEASSPSPDQPFRPSCPDKNKVHFNPTGSAFCPVSLVKPLFPNVGFLFRGFPPPSSPGPGPFPSCQPPAPSPFLGVRKDAAVDGFSEVSKSPSLNYEHWKRGQPDESVVFHSSLVV